MFASNKASSECLLLGLWKHMKYGDTVSMKTATKNRRVKVMRACETAEQCDVRVEQSLLRMSASRPLETHEVRRYRLEEDSHRRAEARANGTTEQREVHLEENRVRIVQTRELLRQSNLKLEAFEYDPQYTKFIQTYILEKWT
ncbi:hypothetical protein AVEN_15253-1 [Araneus ventricosus]|nr:hypothetical protein AVEN_15253-1 [Araneus ventricosus]